MTSFYTLDRANTRLPDVRAVLEDLQARRAELIGLRDRLRALNRGGGARPRSGHAGRRRADGPSADAGEPESPRVLAARIQAVIDQMQAAVERLDDWDITLRDIETGLIDFPALVNGRQVWLCWRLGEDDIAWWHELTTGSPGGGPLVELL